MQILLLENMILNRHLADIEALESNYNQQEVLMLQDLLNIRSQIDKQNQSFYSDKKLLKTASSTTYLPKDKILKTIDLNITFEFRDRPLPDCKMIPLGQEHML
ncbi:unnamed protein product [Paramecium sonneborni]|uniref:Uncharacterized protein n=1 Tax=Paramecium sonneborni TaxID=65129 RepID=A0A8S1KXC6_9CILI|nr:unnamed protein product [Paramecium sonneborni]